MILERGALIDFAASALFGRPLLNNVHRSLLVEAMVAAALPKGWHWNAGDWSSCDLVHDDGTRLEVKQSAARQSWHPPDGKPSASSFDIAPRTGEWVGKEWRAGAGRNAELYVLAHHPVTDGAADHADPTQWRFFPLFSQGLPPTKRNTFGAVLRLPAPAGIIDLPAQVERARLSRVRWEPCFRP